MLHIIVFCSCGRALLLLFVDKQSGASLVLCDWSQALGLLHGRWIRASATQAQSLSLLLLLLLRLFPYLSFPTRTPPLVCSGSPHMTQMAVMPGIRTTFAFKCTFLQANGPLRTQMHSAKCARNLETLACHAQFRPVQVRPGNPKKGKCRTQARREMVRTNV